MALIQNPSYDPALGATAQNQPYIFDNPNTVINPTTGQTATQAIPMDSLGAATPLTVPPPTPQADLGTGIVAGAEQTSKTIQDYINAQTPPETDLSKQIKTLMGETTSLLPGLEGRGVAQVTAEEQTGVNKYFKELAALNTEMMTDLATIKAQDAQYEKLIQQEEGKPITMSSIIGNQAQIRKMQLAESNARKADLGIKQARALGLQGQLEAAQKSADRAVDLMYQDREAIINTKLKQLELYYPELTKQEKIFAEAKAQQLKEQQAKLDEQKATTKSNIQMAINNNITTQFYNRGGEIVRTSDGKAYSTPEQFYKDAGVSSFEEARAKNMITDIGQTGQVQDLMSKYPDAGILPTDDITTASNKIKSNSAIYRKAVNISGAGDGIAGSLSSLTQAVISNPSLFDDLTPTNRGTVIKELQANGYNTSNLGVKGLSDTAIKEISQTEKALSDLSELKNIIEKNQNLIGPISGLQALNPWSEARKIQADIDRVKQTVGKALEGGVLRKEDEEKYKKILATLVDTPSTALYKVDSLISTIQRDIENYKSLQQSSGRSSDVQAQLQKQGSVPTAEELRNKYNY